MSSGKKALDLSAFPSDDEDDVEPQGGAMPAPKANASFGEEYLAQFGWKKGKPIRPGGVVEEYKPKSEGGFSNSSQSRVDRTQLVAGTAIARVQTSGNTAQSVGVITRTDGVSAEVEFVDGTRGVVPIAQLRVASGLEAARIQKRGRETDSGPSGGDASGVPVVDPSAWIVPQLVVRVVEPAPGEDPDKFEPLKATVVKVTRGPGGGRVVLSNGLTVAGSQLDTVLPKKGERGILLGGPHRGKLATVTVRPKDGDIQVTLPDGSAATVAPEHICVCQGV
jgi:hypothetical protein